MYVTVIYIYIYITPFLGSNSNDIIVINSRGNYTQNAALARNLSARFWKLQNKKFQRIRPSSWYDCRTEIIFTTILKVYL